MKNDRNFAVFILTHGRADKVRTYKTLKRQGYTGKLYIIIDNTDKQQEKYIETFGKENVYIFDKKDVGTRCDTMDNFDKMNVILFARNACFEIAKELGITHFLELDDDYTDFAFRYVLDGKFKHNKHCSNLDEVFDAFCDCLDETNADTVAMAQSGDFIAGAKGQRFYQRVIRKAMNSFFCRTDRPFKFIGRINEDVNTYTLLGSQGKLFFTATEASLDQTQTQTSSGGMTETYLDSGTYLKSFYSVIAMPSAVKISMMGGGGNGNNYYRIHHHVSWNNCVPKILDESHKKK